MKKKKILIIAYYFSPFNTIGAVRPSKFSKYLTKTGNYNITVICAKPFEKENDFSRKEDFNYPQKVIQVDQNCVWWRIKRLLLKSIPDHDETFGKYADNKIKNFSWKICMIGKLKKIVLKGAYFLNNKIDETYQKRAEKQLFQLREEFDIVFSCALPISSHEIAYKYKKRYPNVKWIADFRDPMDERDYYFCGKKINYLDIEKTIMKNADYITGVTAECFYHKNLKKFQVMNNAFDQDDLKKVVFNLWNDEKFHIVYTGRLYPKRNCEPLFEVLKELEKEKQIDLNKIEFNYAGPTFFRLQKQASSYHIDQILKNEGIVEHQVALAMQQSSQLLILNTWNDEKRQNMLSGKLYEYMFSGRPTIALVSGTVPNSSMKQIFEEYRLGFCYEEAGNKNLSELKSYIKKLYQEFLENGNTTNDTIWEKVNENSYLNRTKQLENIIIEITRGNT